MYIQVSTSDTTTPGRPPTTTSQVSVSSRLRARGGAMRSETELLQTAIERAAAHAELVGRFADIATVARKDFLYKDFFGLLEREFFCDGRGRRRGLQSKVRGRDLRAARHQHAAFDRMR